MRVAPETQLVLVLSANVQVTLLGTEGRGPESGVQGGFGFGSGAAEEAICFAKVVLHSTTLRHIHATSLEQMEFLKNCGNRQQNSSISAEDQMPKDYLMAFFGWLECSSQL